MRKHFENGELYLVVMTAVFKNCGISQNFFLANDVASLKKKDN